MSWNERTAPSTDARQGVGPLRSPLADTQRPVRQQVFDCVRAHGLVARVQVAKDLGVSPASVTLATTELLEMGLIEEVTSSKDVESTLRGRPAVQLGVRGKAYFVAGIKVSDSELTAVIVDFAGNLICDLLIGRQVGPKALETVLIEIETLLDCLCNKAGMTLDQLSGLGVGLPGFVDVAAGVALWSSIFLERNIHLAAALNAKLNLPVWVDNDANLVALAELWFGVGRGLSDFAVVTIEHGIGMGFVMDHRIYRGAQRLGMELGHTKVQLDGALCRCGQRGCLEAYVADYALAREATTALNWSYRDGTSTSLVLESLFEQAKAGNVTARSIFRRAGRYLAVGLSNVINMFDPALIILSGERMRYDYLYAAETLEEMNNLAINTGRPRPPIEIHAWGDLLWSHGAAALALEALTDAVLGAKREQAAP